MSAAAVAGRVALGGLAAFGMWVSGALTFSLVQDSRAPDRALAVWRTSAAQSGVAARLIDGEVERTRVVRAGALARAALMRSLVNVEAARTLAIAEAAEGHIDRARTIIAYAERLSRRDLPTQLWMIEDRVQAGDVAGSLLHYHRAMQTSRASRDLLSPILAQAADDPAITRPLARLLRSRPEWWSAFLGDFVERTRSPAALAEVTRNLRLDPAVPVERERLSTILQRYVALGQAATGRRLFDRLTGTPPLAVIDGGFERDAAIAPFGWQLVENAAGAGLREPRDGASGGALTLDGNEGQEAARQLLALAPGRHELTLRGGGIRPGFTAPPNLAIRCVPADTPVVQADVPTAPTISRLRVAFVVPAGCDAQLLVVRSARATGYLDDKPWIDDVAIAPLGGRGE